MVAICLGQRCYEIFYGVKRLRKRDEDGRGRPTGYICKVHSLGLHCAQGTRDTRPASGEKIGSRLKTVASQKRDAHSEPSENDRSTRNFWTFPIWRFHTGTTGNNRII